MRNVKMFFALVFTTLVLSAATATAMAQDSTLSAYDIAHDKAVHAAIKSPGTKICFTAGIEEFFPTKEAAVDAYRQKTGTVDTVGGCVTYKQQ